MWSADHAEGLGAPQVLAVGGRGAQRASTWRSVNAAAPPGKGNTHVYCHQGQVDTWPRLPGGGQALTCPFPSAYHAPTYATLQSLFQEDGTGQLSWVVIRLSPHPDASTWHPSCLRPTIVQVPLVGMFVLGLLCLVALDQLCLSASGSQGAGAHDLPRKPMTLPWPMA